jgi:hypothetical protein
MIPKLYTGSSVNVTDLLFSPLNWSQEMDKFDFTGVAATRMDGFCVKSHK